jgi:hypothetical protein
MATSPVRHPAAPFTAPLSGSIDERFAAIAAELNRKANSGIAGPAYHFIGLLSPNGTAWRLTVDDAGALHIEATPRS